VAVVAAVAVAVTAVLCVCRGVHGLHVVVVLFGVWVVGGVGGSRAADLVEDTEVLRAGGVAAAVRVAVPCSTALVVAFAFVSVVVWVLLVVPVAVSTRVRRRRERSQSRLVRCCRGFSLASVPLCTPRCEYVRQGEAACRAEDMLYLKVWPETWMARRHTCSSLVIWGRRRVVEIACEFFGFAEAFERGNCMLYRALLVGVLWYVCPTRPGHGPRTENMGGFTC
jgi:hypothetical protein